MRNILKLISLGKKYHTCDIKENIIEIMERHQMIKQILIKIGGLFLLFIIKYFKDEFHYKFSSFNLLRISTLILLSSSLNCKPISWGCMGLRVFRKSLADHIASGGVSPPQDNSNDRKHCDKGLTRVISGHCSR